MVNKFDNKKYDNSDSPVFYFSAFYSELNLLKAFDK